LVHRQAQAGKIQLTMLGVAEGQRVIRDHLGCECAQPRDRRTSLVEQRAVGQRLRGAGGIVREKLVPQPPRERGLNALRVHYRCRDGRWLLLSKAPDEWRWEKLKECLAAPALDDPRFATASSREAHAGELIRILDGIFVTKDQLEWRRILDEAGLIFGIVADMDEIADDAQILASEALVLFVDGSSLTVNSPIWIRGQQKTAPRPAPAVGEHSEEVLRAAGSAAAEIAVLRAEGVIG
jgi:formyl-CoA transferase